MTMCPEGWQLVPKEATDAMLQAADHYNEKHIVGDWSFAECYAAMVAAAPAHTDAELPGSNK